MLDSPEWENFREAYDQIMVDEEKASEIFWNSLCQEDQLKAFCAVVRRIHKGEVEDRGSYRHVLYSGFGFGPEAYTLAQGAGSLDIHNSIVSDE